MTAPGIVCVLLLLCMSCSRADAAEGDALAAATARYYADGLQAALLQIRAGATIVETCKKRFRPKCSKRHREAADKARYTLEYLDALTLTAPRPRDDDRPAATVTTYEDVVAALDTVNERILRAAREYDHVLFARYEATLEMCPPESVTQYRESLATLEQLDIRAFGSPVDASPALPAISPDACAATRDFGELLMTMMSAKLEPWRRGADAVPSAEATRSIANEFLFEVATELEVTVYPDSRGTFDAIAQRLHDSEPAAPKKTRLQPELVSPAQWVKTAASAPAVSRTAASTASESMSSPLNFSSSLRCGEYTMRTPTGCPAKVPSSTDTSGGCLPVTSLPSNQPPVDSCRAHLLPG